MVSDSKFSGIPRIPHNKMGQMQETFYEIFKNEWIGLLDAYFNSEIIVVVPGTWSPDIGFDSNPTQVLWRLKEPF